ncbi:rRNA-processing protein bfr2 [Hypoxylon texense]
MATIQRRFIHQSFRALSHENPLGLPRTGSIPRMQRGLPERRKIKDVAKVVAVSSAKGGVGKSTVAANLSLAFARMGYRSGILDTDIFGPSIPTLFDLSGEPRLSSNNQLLPMSNYGVKTMSMGYLVGEDAPVVWRGLMVMKALQQLLHEVDWGGLDILVLDLPPGTGDTQLSVTQQIVLDAVFGSSDRVKQVCDEHSIDLLGDIPLHQNVGDDGQRGKPTVVSEPDSERAQAFMDIARMVGSKVGL